MILYNQLMTILNHRDDPCDFANYVLSDAWNSRAKWRRLDFTSIASFSRGLLSRLKGRCRVKIDFPFDATLPDTYINEVSLRMEIYQRLGEAITWEEVNEIS
jgi:hypothetical protein